MYVLQSHFSLCVSEREVHWIFLLCELFFSVFKQDFDQKTRQIKYSVVYSKYYRRGNNSKIPNKQVKTTQQEKLNFLNNVTPMVPELQRRDVFN